MKWLRLASLAGVVLAVLVLAASMATLYAANVEVSVGNRRGVMFKEAQVVSVGSGSITALVDGNLVELRAGGKWLVVAEGALCEANWSKVAELVGEGSAKLAFIKEAEGSLSVLLGLKQGDVLVFRPALLELCAKRWLHTRTYLSVKARIVEKGSNYLVLERSSYRALAFINGSWVKAGVGEVQWSQVADEFKVGDEVRLFCHNVLLVDQGFEEAFGLAGFIWGYSGAIIDLSSGTALSRLVVAG